MSKFAKPNKKKPEFVKVQVNDKITKVKKRNKEKDDQTFFEKRNNIKKAAA
jgi:hypothetical protein